MGLRRDLGDQKRVWGAKGTRARVGSGQTRKMMGSHVDEVFLHGDQSPKNE